jgi:sterol desaturase/sphingolipid hydroxylase (fatty acid hydroxylase superfamily)
LDLVASSLSQASIAALFVAVALWELARPERLPNLPAGPRWFANLALLAIRIGVSAGVATLLIATATVLLFRMSLLPTPEGYLGVAAHFVVIVLALDLGNYLLHRAMHASPWLWRVHAIHHTDLDLDTTTAFRSHPVEVILVGLALGVIGGLLGASPGEVASFGVLVSAVQLVAHANVRLPQWLASGVEALIVTPGFHRFHHSRDERECHSNFGSLLVLWDRVFGTAVGSTSRCPTGFGVSDFLDPRDQRLGRMLLQPVLGAARRHQPVSPDSAST